MNKNVLITNTFCHFNSQQCSKIFFLSLKEFFVVNWLQWHYKLYYLFSSNPCQRIYHVGHTSSHSNTEVKQHWAWILLGWETLQGIPGSAGTYPPSPLRTEYSLFRLSLSQSSDWDPLKQNKTKKQQPLKSMTISKMHCFIRSLPRK